MSLLDRKCVEYVTTLRKPIELFEVTKLTDFGIHLPKMLPLGKISFNQWIPKGSTEVRILVKPRYRRIHDYDMWIDLKNKTIYLDNPSKCCHLIEELESVHSALKSMFNFDEFNCVTGIPKDNFKFLAKKSFI